MQVWSALMGINFLNIFYLSLCIFFISLSIFLVYATIYVRHLNKEKRIKVFVEDSLKKRVVAENDDSEKFLYGAN